MNITEVAIGNIALIPLIIGLVQLFKRFFPTLPTNVWLGLSFLFGIVGQMIVFVIAHGGTFTSAGAWTLETWALAVVLGLTVGLAAAKAYDAADASQNRVGRAVRGIAKQ